MNPSSLPYTEVARLAALRHYEIVDTPAEAQFDDFTRLAARICDAPVALIALVDSGRLWLKSRLGLDASELPLSAPACGDALLRKGLTVVSDTALDTGFTDNPLVNGSPPMRFYAGALLESCDGLPLGALCVLDGRPRQITELQGEALLMLARQVMTTLELRLSRRSLQLTIESISDAFLTLDQEFRFTYINSQAERLLGHGKDEVLGRRVHEVCELGLESPFIIQFRRAAAERQPVALEAFYQRTELWLDMRAYPSPAGLTVYFQDVTARRRKDEQLRLLETCVSRLNDIVLITEAEPIEEPGPRIVYVNDAFVRRTGYSREETLGRSPRFLRGSKIRRESIDRIRSALKERRPVREEVVNRTKSGEDYWLELDIVPVADASGTVTHWVSIERDITERKLAEEKLRASEASMATAQRITHFGSWELDLTNQDDVNANPLRWSDEMFRIAGFEPGAVAVSNELFFMLTHPEDRVRVGLAVQEAIRENRPYSITHRLIRPDGEERIVHEMAHLFFDEHTGELLKMVGTAHDITDQRLAEEKLREQATLLDKAQDAILVRDLDHRILYWNRSAERLYGWTAAEAWGRPVMEFLYSDPAKFHAAMEACLARGEWVGVLQKLGKGGRALTVEARWTLVRDDLGLPKSILAIDTDITERNKLEQQFLRAQRMESIGTLAGGIAHDLNNVLAPIMMSIDVLRLEEQNPRRLGILTTIEASARRGADMVQQVLSFAEGVRGQQLRVQVGRLVGEIAKIADDTFQKNIQVRSDVPADLWVVQGDPTQLHQVLLNLCINARDVMPDGGVLTLTASNMLLDEQYAGMNIEARPGPHVVIQVEDTGCGIPPEVIERIFEPFFTTKGPGKGTGLGLSTTLAIVKSHGGFVRVYSEVGLGTKFRVYLPAQTTPDSGNEAPAQAELPRGNGEVVLVVDDEASVRQITRQTLEAFGYRVLLASDGAGATALYAVHMNEVAVVLTDMMMPIMDGPSTIQVLMRMNPQARIIAASGLNANSMVARATSAGVRHFLPKPYTAEAMLQALRLVLQS